MSKPSSQSGAAGSPPPRRLRLLLCLALLTAAGIRPCAAAEIAVVLGEEGAAHAQVAEGIRSRLEPAHKVSLHKAAEPLPTQSGARFVVAVGSRAAARLAPQAEGAPLLVTLLPQQAYERLLAENRRSGIARPMSALYLDQPVERQLDLLRLALPEARRVGVLLGAETKNRYNALAAAAMNRGLRLHARSVAKEEGGLAAALQALLPTSDLLLALPDAAVFNAGTIQMILLATYRHRQPLIGFSPAYTRAGALLALYSTPAQIGEEAAEMLLAAIAKGSLPAPQHPRRFVVATNPHVARSLGIPIENGERLQQRLIAMEAR